MKRIKVIGFILTFTLTITGIQAQEWKPWKRESRKKRQGQRGKK